MRAPAAICAVVLLPLALAACGDQSSDPPEEGSEPGEWRAERLEGEPAVDHPTLFVTDDDDALVLMLSDDGVVQSHLSAIGSEFEAGEPLDLGEKLASLGDVVRLDDGSWLALGNAGVVEVDGDEEHTYDPMALRSDDGLAWERTEITGFADAVEFTDVEVVDGRIVAVGSYRTSADPGQGGFEARAWTSADGRTFEEVRLPDVPDYRGYDDESYAGSVVTVDGMLLATGRIGGAAVVWRSADGGFTWTRVEDPLLRGAYAITDLGVVGATVVASAAGTDTSAIRSTDGGTTWSAVDALPLASEEEGWAPMWSDSERFYTLTGVDDMSWSEPEVCYADIAQCDDERRPAPTVVASVDGARWTAVETPGGEEPDAIGGTADGRVLMLAGAGEGVAVHTWPAGVELPEAAEPAAPERVELLVVPEGEEPEVGVRYHAPIYVHCGMDWLWFADETWRRTDGGPGVETGAGETAPDDWPLVEQQQTLYGYATVRSDRVLEYSLEDGTVIATFERSSGAPGCD